jgi:hypothetical protein
MSVLIVPEEERQLESFVSALRRQHGCDFSQYARTSFRRRLMSLVSNLGCASIAALSVPPRGRLCPRPGQAGFCGRSE